MPPISNNEARMLEEITKLKVTVDNIKESMDTLIDSTKTIAAAIEPMNIRVDRLEQKESSRDWWVKTLITTTVGLISAVCFQMFRGK
jgi:hypothetical protein